MRMPRFRKILCPVDFDPNSLLALRLAAELTREGKGILDIVHVLALPPGPEVSLPFGKMEATARTRLERLARQKVGNAVRYEVHVMMGDPGVEVLQTAKRLRSDLIVMATHGRKGLRHLILGSVAEYVIREAPCPVLTLRPKPARRSQAVQKSGSREAARRSKE